MRKDKVFHCTTDELKAAIKEHLSSKHSQVFGQQFYPITDKRELDKAADWFMRQVIPVLDKVNIGVFDPEEHL